MSPLGRHFLVEMYDAQNLDRPDIIEQALVDCVRASGGTLLDVRVVPFPNGAASGVAIIAESHASIHTWPEYGYAAVDMFTCSPMMDPEAGVEVLRAAFLAGRVEITEIPRGTGIGVQPVAG